MKISKHGKIFDPSDHDLPAGLSLYAKSPQALVFDDFVRVYFSSQRMDEKGKWLTVPLFADFTNDLKHVLRISERPVISLGGLGHFDEHGIFPINVIRFEEGFRAYLSGWSRRKSVSIDMAIGLAVSDDGSYFEKPGAGGPIISASKNEPFLIGDPFVFIERGIHHMWYIYGDKWAFQKSGDEPDRFYKIAYAWSDDGLSWQRDSVPIIPVKSSNECQALPSVIKRGELYHMFFCYRNAYGFRDNPEDSYRIGYACSNDLKTWRRDDNVDGMCLSGAGWDSEMMCYPNVFQNKGEYFLLYNGNEFGKFGFGFAKIEF